MKANQATTYTKTYIDNNSLLKADKSTNTNTEVNTSFNKLQDQLDLKAQINNPKFTGTVLGNSKEG